MLMLKCSICLEMLKTLECGPTVAPCGHIYCQICLEAMSKTRERTNCALCRQAFTVTSVVRLFVEYEETRSAPAPPLTTSQVKTGQALIEACAGISDDAGEEEAIQHVVSAENILMDIEKTHKGTDAEQLLKTIYVSLGEFRKRLKLFSRINVLQQKNAELEEETDSLRRAVVDQLKEADEAEQTISKLERRLKRTNLELEKHRSREHQDHAASNNAMREMENELQNGRAALASYKKKYYVALQKLKEVKPGKGIPDQYIGSTGGPPTLKTENLDDSLEIISPPDLQNHPDAVIKESLRRQISAEPSMVDPFRDYKRKRKAIKEEPNKFNPPISGVLGTVHH